jgi:hypothetical protein
MTLVEELSGSAKAAGDKKIVDPEMKRPASASVTLR